jgi:hypothetical protein
LDEYVAPAGETPYQGFKSARLVVGREALAASKIPRVKIEKIIK